MDGTNNSTSFSDSSTSPKAVSSQGDAKVSTAHSKFGGASLTLDGSGDYLQINSSNDLAFGTGDFTVELYVRLNSLGSQYTGFVNTQANLWSANASKWYFGHQQGYGLVFGRHSTSDKAYTAWTPSLNTWYHVAASRKNGVMYLAIDGVNKAVTNSSTFNGVSLDMDKFTIGVIASPFYTDGFIDEVRVTKGEALYTNNFSVPVTAFGPGVNCYSNGVATNDLNSSGTGTCSGDGKYYVNGVKANGTYNGLLYVQGTVANGYISPGTELLLHFDGANNSTTFVDSSGSQKTLTATGESAISTAQSKFGGGSAIISESSIVSSEIISISQGQDFAIEMWLYDFIPWVNWDGRQPAAISIGGFVLWLHDNIRGTFIHDGQSYLTQGWGVGVPPANQWSHVAVTRQANTLRVFIDGVLKESTTYSSPISGVVTIGGVYTPTGGNYQGYVDEVRITKGSAQYTSNFTPSSAAFSGGSCFVNGVATNTVDSNGNGTCNGVTYVNGVPQ
jgi:hypothetical protein